MNSLSFPSHLLSAKDFPRFVIFMGGTSSEREISLQSGSCIIDIASAHQLDFDVLNIKAHSDVFDWLYGNSTQKNPVEKVFIALHGGIGEDGQIQAILETAGMAYTGANAKGCCLAMDKWVSKQLWQAAGLPVPVAQLEDINSAESNIGYPLMVKPMGEGSSVGMSKVNDHSEYQQALDDASRYSQRVIVEQYIRGREITANILNGQALPLIEICTPRAFYDYEAKYFANDTQYICPAELTTAQTTSIQTMALEAADILGVNNWGRVDFMLDAYDAPHLIELNTIPGMTSHSLFPMSAREAGMTDIEWLYQLLK